VSVVVTARFVVTGTAACGFANVAAFRGGRLTADAAIFAKPRLD
jgi:hypothetical protein